MYPQEKWRLGQPVTCPVLERKESSADLVKCYVRGQPRKRFPAAGHPRLVLSQPAYPWGWAEGSGLGEGCLSCISG